MKPSTRDNVREMRDRYEHELDRIIEQGKSEGWFHTPIETRMVTRAIIGMCNSAYLWYSPDQRLTPEDIGKAFAEMALGIVLVHQPAVPAP
jgi:hypothetical protein